MKVFVTGAAGFIGSHVVDRLLVDGLSVTGWDNFSTGQERYLEGALSHPNFCLVRGDNLDLTALTTAMKGCDLVLHFAANADVRFGTQHPGKDLEQNTTATFHVLEAMRANGIKRLGFTSTGSVYGECSVIPTPEHAPFPVQTSLYGASKVACEGMIAAYAEGFGFECYIFRLVSIVGERYTHGHILDFHRQLLDHPDRLTILGDGSPRKSYLYIQDCADAILHVIRLGTARDAKHRTQIYNLGTSEYVTVNDSVRSICRTLNLDPKLHYTGGDRGWVGDNPFIFLDTKKIVATGWKPKLTIEQAIIKTVRWLDANCWVHGQRR